MKNTLYELTGDYRNLIDQYNQAESDDEAEAILKQIESIEAPFEEKVENCARIIVSEIAKIDAIDAEIVRLSQRKQSLERGVDNLKEYTKMCMLQTGLPKPKVVTELFTVWVQSNSAPAVKLSVEPKDLPEEFREEVTIYKAKTKEIVKLWKEGAELPESISVQLGSHLRIK